tara:strand:+ start:70 stop:1248 length:1179 start_codon:yes stop_codon:yes gene_type:complete
MLRDVTLSVLVVDDEIIIARNLEQILERMGLKVVDIACSGEEAIELAHKFKPDLIYMDIRLNGDLDGIETAQIISDELNIPVIFLTAYADEQTLTRAKDTAPYGYLVKPVSERDIQIITNVAIGRHRTEMKLRLAKRQLQEANENLEAQVQARTAKLATQIELLASANKQLEQFAFIASHDLKEPLRKISTFGQMLESSDRDNLSSQGQEYLSYMLKSGHRMQELLDSLLLYSRLSIQKHKTQPTNLNHVVMEVCSDLELKITECNAQIDAEPLPTITADKAQFRQLFQNLIDNSLKYRKADVAPIIHITANKDPQTAGWTIDISDNGIGFEPEYSEQVFEVFRRLHGKNEYSGTGMGLAICRKIAERHHGRLTASGEADKGATFSIYLPAE